MDLDLDNTLAQGMGMMSLGQRVNAQRERETVTRNPTLRGAGRWVSPNLHSLRAKFEDPSTAKLEDLADNYRIVPTVPRSQRVKCTTFTPNPVKRAPATIHRFSNFPPELRIKIWKLARPEARVVVVLWSKKGTPHSPSPIPGMLHACLESRKVALEWYNFCFRQPYDSSVEEFASSDLWMDPHNVVGFEAGMKIKKRIFFDFDRDWLYHNCECGNVWCKKCNDLFGNIDERRLVKRLVLAWNKASSTSPLFPVVLHFPNVKELILSDAARSVNYSGSNYSDLKTADIVFRFQRGRTHKARTEELFNIPPLKPIEWSLDSIRAAELSPSAMVQKPIPMTGLTEAVFFPGVGQQSSKSSTCYPVERQSYGVGHTGLEHR